MRLRKISLLLLLLPLALIITACSPARTKQELVVGMELAYPPFEMTDEQNRPTGLSVDLAQALADELGRDLVIENMAWSGLIPSLETGKVDLIISSMTVTEERAQRVDFSEPYAVANLSLLINKDSAVTSYADLDQPGRVLAVKKGSTGHIYAEKNLKHATIMVFDKESVCVLEVVQGKADAFTYDQLTIFRNWQQYPDQTRVNLEPYQEEAEYWAVALAKDQPELKGEINEFIKNFRSGGGFDKLAEQYLPEEKKAFADLGIPFFFSVGE